MTAFDAFYDGLDTALLVRMRDGLERDRADYAAHGSAVGSYLQQRIAVIDAALQERGLHYIVRPRVGMLTGSFTCLTCHRTSYNPHDAEQRYCGYCHRFHDDAAAQAAQLKKAKGI
jgi:hypothetical protein